MSVKPGEVVAIETRGSLALMQTCFMMRRDRMFMTKPPSRGYMVRDWMTVRMSSMGRGFWSISCCITTANTSDVYTFFSPKQRLVAGAENTTTVHTSVVYNVFTILIVLYIIKITWLQFFISMP